MSGPLNLVLLVDDETVTKVMHQRLIVRRGLVRAVDVATDGQAAIDYLEARLERNAAPPELILLEINMPRLRGFEFLDALTAFPAGFRSQQRIAMVSTTTLRRDRARADAHPELHAFWSKPLGADDIECIVRGGIEQQDRPAREGSARR